MALNFQQVYKKIQEIGATLKERKEALDKRRIDAKRLLTIYADDLEGLRAKVEAVKAIDPSVRCALPFKERLDAHIPPPEVPPNAILIAADGSQINPDRHGPVQFGLINVGAVILHLNSGNAPIVRTESELLFDEELYAVNGAPITDLIVALRRDLKERTRLYELAVEFDGDDDIPIITFTDGPIELWGAKDGEEAGAFQLILTTYKSVLSQLQERGVVTAGYVERPGADLLIRLLELAEMPPEQMHDSREYHPLRGVKDRWLFGYQNKDFQLLAPGERSAVFTLQSKAEKDYKGVLALHFFYLNVGTEGHAWPVRIEIPRWVAEDDVRLGMLHAVLVAQCHMLGARPYPYLLLRAHEMAVVKHDERDQVELLLLREIRERGGETEDRTYKDANKRNLGGRTSY